MRRIKLVVAYDGTGYNGWQVQSSAPTVQGELERAIGRVLKHRVRVVGAGRTDTGVHAFGQVVHFDTDSTMDVDVMLKAFNANLPSSIVVRDVCEVEQDFHARFSAKSRVYRYFITRVNLPFFSRYAWYIGQPLDVEAMIEASGYFVGEHDFRLYGSPMTPGGSTVRFVKRCRVKPRRWRIEVVVEANAFLRRMVRNMVGALVKVGLHRATPEDVKASVEEAVPLKKGLKPAPPNGLFLWKVVY